MIKLLKSIVRNHFGFSRSETNGMLLLLPLVLFTIFSPVLFDYYYDLYEKETFPDVKSAIKWKKELEKNIRLKEPVEKEIPVWKTKNTRKKTADLQNQQRKKLFDFNPNEVTAEELRSLGFNRRVAGNWVKFRKEGASYHQISDLKKIYGMDTAYLTSISNYINFPPKPNAGSYQRDSTYTGHHEKKIPAQVILVSDLNLTTADDLRKISGIGEKLSQRIIKYRDKLHGYHSLSQLYEVYGLDSTVIEKVNEKFHLKADAELIDINIIDEQKLAEHPYFSRRLARIIINFRKQHGKYHSADDLRKIHILNDSILSKMAPYLRFAERSDIFNEE